MHEIRNIQTPYTQDDFWTQWNSVTPRMCTCLKITPQTQYGGSAAAKCFTSNTADMTLPGHPGKTFLSAPGLSPSAVEMALDEPPNLEVMGVYQTGVLTQAEIAAGVLDFAEADLFTVCWDNVNLGEFVQMRGNLGRVTDRQTYVNAEMRGLIARLMQDTHDETSRNCRAPEFGDVNFCKKDLTGTVPLGGVAYKIKQTAVTAVYENVDQLTFNTSLFSGNKPADAAALNTYGAQFRNGKIHVNAGPNAGAEREIAFAENFSFPTMILYLKRPFPYVDETSRSVTITMGCDHTLESCVLYDNVIHRRAEDWIPGPEAVTRLPLK